MAWTELLPSGKYRGGYRLPNGSKRSAGTFTHKRAAIRAAEDAEEDAAMPGWKDPKAGSRKWGEWVDEWWQTRTVSDQTLQSELSMRERIDKHWKDEAIGGIDRQAVLGWIAGLLKDGLEPSSVNRHLAVFRTSMTAAFKAGIIQVNPAEKTSLKLGEKDRRRYLTQKEAQSLIDELPRSIDKAFTAALFGCGLRFGEAAGLQVNRLSPERNSLRVAETWIVRTARLSSYPKGRKIRSVPVPNWVASKMEPLIGRRKDGFVFTREQEQVMQYANFSKRFVRAAERAGLEGVTVHDTRHTYASWLLQNGISLAEVGRLLGHVDSKTTEIYAHLAPQQTEHIFAALPDLD